MIGQLLIRQSSRIELSQTVLQIILKEDNSDLNGDFVDFDDFTAGWRLSIATVFAGPLGPTIDDVAISIDHIPIGPNRE